VGVVQACTWRGPRGRIADRRHSGAGEEREEVTEAWATTKQDGETAAWVVSQVPAWTAERKVAGGASAEGGCSPRNESLRMATRPEGVRGEARDFRTLLRALPVTMGKRKWPVASKEDGSRKGLCRTFPNPFSRRTGHGKAYDGWL
jgi:hypothetical protein